MQYWRLDDEPTLVQEEGDVVKITWENDVVGKIDIEFVVDGDTARPKQVVVFTRQKDGFVVWTTSTYSYDEEKVLRQIEKIVPSTGTKKIVGIKKADFDTLPEDSIFELTYADGTKVKDEVTGITYRNRISIPEDWSDLDMVPQLEEDLNMVVGAFKQVENSGESDVSTGDEPSQNSTPLTEDGDSEEGGVLPVAIFILVVLAVAAVVVFMKRSAKKGME